MSGGRNTKRQSNNKNKSKHEEIAAEMMHEKTAKWSQNSKKIVADKSQNAFWKEKKRVSNNPTLESLIIKDVSGRRLFTPDEVKEGTALLAM